MHIKFLISLVIALVAVFTPNSVYAAAGEAASMSSQTSNSSGSKKKSAASKKQSGSGNTQSAQKKSAKNGATKQKATSLAKQSANAKRVETRKGGASNGSKSKRKKSSGVKTEKKAGGTTESSAEVKRQQEATQREISDTKKKIQLNDASIKKGVDELGRLQGDIGESKEKVKVASNEVNSLSDKITTLEKQVTEEEAQLVKLRSEYLKAIKKMRAAGKNNSTLAFIFSSGSFNQALRRMRYLKQFSEWKDRQSSMITEKVKLLNSQKKELSRTLSAKDAALRQHQAAQAALERQYARQDAIVVELKANGEALNAHLAKKQAEANTLRNRISALIAAEEQQRRAREVEEKRAREEEQRRAREVEERRAREEAQKIFAPTTPEQDKSTIQESTETKAPAKLQKGKVAGAEKKKDSGASRRQTRKDNNVGGKEKKSSESSKTPTKKDVPAVKEAESGKSSSDYANARKRQPRSEAKEGTKASAKASTPSKSSTPADAGSFEKMRGSLPRPVSGSFRIVSPFGRHALPELPDVIYDNPGIDAQTSAGASALAVYGGKVSGVYMIPGFSTVVIVNHGNYYTVYGNIASPAVKVGDSVKQGQNLGKLAVDEDDSSHSAIHFEVWKNREKLNPSEWIR